MLKTKLKFICYYFLLNFSLFWSHECIILVFDFSVILFILLYCRILVSLAVPLRSGWWESEISKEAEGERREGCERNEIEGRAVGIWGMPSLQITGGSECVIRALWSITWALIDTNHLPSTLPLCTQIITLPRSPPPPQRWWWWWLRSESHLSAPPPLPQRAP